LSRRAADIGQQMKIVTGPVVLALTFGTDPSIAADETPDLLPAS
jgi:hypothetical protein